MLCAGVEGDSVTQSSDGTDLDGDHHYEEQAGRGEEEQDTSEGVESGEEECNATGEGEVNEETSGADTTGDGNVYEEESGDYTTDEGQEGDSKLEEWDTSREGQNMLGGRVVGYLDDSFGSSGVGDISGGGLEEGELPQDSSREMDSKGIHILTLGNIAGVKLDKID